MPDLGKNFVRQELRGITVGLSGYPQGFADKHLGRTEPVTIGWNTSYKGQHHLNCKVNDVKITQREDSLV